MIKERTRTNSDSYANYASLHISPFAFLTKGSNEIVGFQTKISLPGALFNKHHASFHLQNYNCPLPTLPRADSTFRNVCPTTNVLTVHVHFVFSMFLANIRDSHRR